MACAVKASATVFVEALEKQWRNEMDALAEAVRKRLNELEKRIEACEKALNEMKKSAKDKNASE